MSTPRTPEATKTASIYPTPDSIRYRPRKKVAIGPTCPSARDDRDADTVLKRAPRKVKTVDPVYLPSNEWGDDDVDEEEDGALLPVTRKRKRTPGMVLTGKESSSKTPKERKVTPPSTKIADDAYELLGLPVTPTGPVHQIGSPGGFAIYPTPSSPNESPSIRKRKRSEPAVLGTPPPSDSTVDFDNHSTDPSWDSPKAGKRSRSSSKVPDNELYLPSPKTSSRTFSKRQPLLDGFDNDRVSDEDDEYLNGLSVSRNETKGVVYDFSLERAKRWAAAVSLSEKTWSEAEKELFLRLAMRGFEPLLPRYWQHDFSTLPETLFPISEDEEGPLIQTLKNSDFHAIKSLAKLFSLGGQVRDCSILQGRPEVKIKRAIKDYIRWAFHDADLHTKPGAIPVHAIHAQKRGESIVAAVTRLNRRLEALAKRYHDTLGALAEQYDDLVVEIKQKPDTTQNPRHMFPLLVGFVICGPIVAILMLDTDPLRPKARGEEGTGSKFISQFDVEERGQDVWTSLAVAITAMHIRQTMIHLANDGKSGFYRFKEAIHPGSDEDL